MTTLRCIRCAVDKDSVEDFYQRTRTYPKAGAVTAVMQPCKACKKAAEAATYKPKRPKVPAGHKFCPHCKGILVIERFGVNAGRKDGRQVYCLDCWDGVVRKIYSKKKLRETGTPTHVPHDAETNKLHRAARNYAYYAVLFGDLVPKDCEVCGAKEVQGHHTDYRRPLVVTWLCTTHHSAAHGGKPMGSRMARRHQAVK